MRVAKTYAMVSSLPELEYIRDSKQIESRKPGRAKSEKTRPIFNMEPKPAENGRFEKIGKMKKLRIAERKENYGRF